MRLVVDQDVYHVTIEWLSPIDIEFAAYRAAGRRPQEVTDNHPTPNTQHPTPMTGLGLRSAVGGPIP